MNFVEILPCAITGNDATPLVDVGSIAMVDSKTYMYVQFDNGTSAVAAAANATCYWYDETYYIVTSDIGDSSENRACGVFTVALTDQYYGWVLIDGYCSALKTDGGDAIAAGDFLTAVSGTDGVVTRATANTAAPYRVVGVATAADSDANNTVAAYILMGLGSY